MDSKTMIIPAIRLLVVSILLTTSVCRAEESQNISVSEKVSCRLVPHRLSEFKVSDDGFSVAYMAGSGRYGEQFSEEGVGSDWEFKKLIVDGRPESINNHWYENTDWIAYSPDHTKVARVKNSPSASGPSQIELNDQPQTFYGQVHAPQFSPDSKHFVYVADLIGFKGQIVVLDGVEGGRYLSISYNGNLKFSPDSQRLAFFADRAGERGRERFAVIDGKEGKVYRSLEQPIVFSPDSKHFAYTAETFEKKWTAVIDGTEGRHFEAQHISEPTFSPDSKRLAYTVNVGFGGGFVVVDDLIGKRFNQVWPDKVQFSFDSKHFAYKAHDGKKWFIVVDHKEGSGYDQISQITYSPVDVQLAYVAHVGSEAFVVRDGVPGKKYDQIANLVFSPDGRALVYAAHVKKGQQWVVVINGRELSAYDFVLAKGAYDTIYSGNEGTAAIVGESSLRFENAEMLRFLAVRKKSVLMVRGHLAQGAAPSTK
jgi:Tol biopolymer transport system component